MRYLRDKYGHKVADRSLKRAQKREQRTRTEHTPTMPTSTQMPSGVF